MNNLLSLKKRRCPSCGSKNYSNFYINKHYSKIDTKGIIYRFKHILVMCNYCNLVYSNPWLGEKNTNKIYSNSSIGAAFEKSNKAEKHFKCFKSFFKNKNSFKKNIKILEIGTATGILLKNISNYYNLKKKNIFGIEPSKKLFEKLRNNKFFHIENKFVDQIKLNKKYDLIIMDNVLEHIEDPNKVLKKIKLILNENGIIYIAVPNILKYKKNFRDPFGHTINYYVNNIKYLFNSNGFKITEFKKHFNYLNFTAKINKTNYIPKYDFKNDRKLKFKKVKKFLNEAKTYKKKLIKKFTKIENTIKKNNLEILLYGSSNFALEFLNYTNLKKNIKFILDTNPIYHSKKRFGFKVISPKKIKKILFDKIIITSRAFSNDIFKTLIKLNVPRNKIIKL